MAAATRWVSVLGFAICAGLAAPACSDDACGCALDPSGDMESWTSDAPVVVIADVFAQRAAEGRAAIRPVATLRGSLPLDERGLYWFVPSADVADERGLWLFDRDGSPYRRATEEGVHVPDYPWRDYEALLEQAFSEQVDQEYQRVLAEADLVVALEFDDGTEQLRARGVLGATVSSVIRGPVDVAEGDYLVFTFPAWSWVELYLYEGESVWALSRIGDDWVTTPSWISPGWPPGSTGDEKVRDLNGGEAEEPPVTSA